MREYPQVLFIMAKIMEMNKVEQNKIQLYMINTLNII